MDHVLRSPSLLVAVAVSLAGCSANVVPPDPTPVPSKTPPPRGTVERPGDRRVYAMDTLYLGLRTRDGKPTSTGWNQFGYDLDGQSTTKADQAKVCKGPAGTPPAVDGEGGVDNAFGAEVARIFGSVSSDTEPQIQSEIRSGQWTWVLVLEDVGGYEDRTAPGHLYLAVGLPTAPLFTPRDHWPIAAGIDFPDGYVREGKWVSGPPKAIPLSLRLVKEPTTLELEGAFITFDLTEHTGVVAGALPVAKLRKVLTAPMMQLRFCTSLLDFLDESTKWGADLVLGAPSLQDPAQTCDALSVGIGFHALPSGEPVAGGPSKLPEGPMPLPCKPGL